MITDTELSEFQIASLLVAALILLGLTIRLGISFWTEIRN
jgi:HAMP domain-containing protein